MTTAETGGLTSCLSLRTSGETDNCRYEETPLLLVVFIKIEASRDRAACKSPSHFSCVTASERFKVEGKLADSDRSPPTRDTRKLSSHRCVIGFLEENRISNTPLKSD
ncbi:hypothetical protein EVAR_58142_1 [Eumeta japonica]|uniref:Uncharacterized protein n=1 Tax=Eumeta variegata TaxID=151549 RepID=A0A4C1X381_EUMVA|nr:hypothetical protein EVAR_58142_1 [Eumeta japonica]